MKERFKVEPYNEGGSFGWKVIDTKTGEEVGSDGGEPEDQILPRHWSWVPEALNKVAAEAADLEKTANAETDRATIAESNAENALRDLREERSRANDYLTELRTLRKQNTQLYERLASETERNGVEVTDLQARLKRFTDDALAGLAGVVCTPLEGYLRAPHCFPADLARLRAMWEAAAKEVEHIAAERDAAMKAKQEAEAEYVKMFDREAESAGKVALLERSQQMLMEQRDAANQRANAVQAENVALRSQFAQALDGVRTVADEAKRVLYEVARDSRIRGTRLGKIAQSVHDALLAALSSPSSAWKMGPPKPFEQAQRESDEAIAEMLADEMKGSEPCSVAPPPVPEAEHCDRCGGHREIRPGPCIACEVKERGLVIPHALLQPLPKLGIKNAQGSEDKVPNPSHVSGACHQEQHERCSAELIGEISCQCQCHVAQSVASLAKDAEPKTAEQIEQENSETQAEILADVLKRSNDCVVGVNFSSLEKQRTVYRCPKGHCEEHTVFDTPLYFNYGEGPVAVCSQCIKEFIDLNLRLMIVPEPARLMFVPEPEKNG